MSNDNSNNPLVSIIVPSYNHAGFLEQRLQSILRQTYQQFELIILDDCSADNSMDIIQRYSNEPHVTHVIRNEQNSGSPFKQWYKGITLAKGNIIWIAECDDSCLPDMLERLVKVYTLYDCSFAFTRSMIIDDKGERKGVSQRQFKRDGHWDGQRFIRKYLCISNTVRNASSVIFSKRNALSISKDFMSYSESGDWVFWIEMALKGNVAVISEPLSLFRIHGETNTSRATKSGMIDKEDKHIFDWLRRRQLMSWISAFVKQKRMAKRILKGRKIYADEQVRQEVKDAWDLSPIYYGLGRLAMRYHQLFK